MNFPIAVRILQADGFYAFWIILSIVIIKKKDNACRFCRWWKIPYFWAGIKMYDLIAGRQLLHSSYFVGKNKALQLFPMLKKENLAGGIVYYDGE